MEIARHVCDVPMAVGRRVDVAMQCLTERSKSVKETAMRSGMIDCTMQSASKQGHKQSREKSRQIR